MTAPSFLVDRIRRQAGLAALLALGLALGAPAAFAEIVVRVPQDQATLTAAVTAVPAGGTIELAAGTYASPSQGFQFSNLAKGFTVRAAANALVYLDGGSARPVLRMENSSLGNGRPIVFDSLVFRNGSSAIATTAGGVTIRRGEATFVNCTFENNQRLETTLSELAGGGVGVSIGSRVFFDRSTFRNNRSKNNGGGLSISESSVAHIHASQFYDNLTNVPGHRNTASGGAISVVNADLYVTNSRFQGNRSGYVGGAITALGTWVDPVGIPSTEVVIANSTFIDNRAAANGVVLPGPSEAGAVHAEDQATMRIFNSRFEDNVAQTGGAVNLYRAIVEVNDSVLIGNRADGSTAGGFGGAFNVLSNDTSSGEPDRRSGALTVRRSYVQGATPPTINSVAKTGGCLAVAGDFNRRMGLVTPQGTAASTRATLVFEDVVLHDCDVTAGSAAAGGGFDIYLTNATLIDGLVLGSDAAGPSSSGGAGRITSESAATLTNVTFSRNTAGSYGGALWLQGSNIDIIGSHFLWNEVSPGTAEPIGSSFGAALFTAGQDDWPTAPTKQNQTGAVSSSVFSQNIGIAVFDDDRNQAGNWINDERYESNTFFSTTFGQDIYRNPLAGNQTAAGLNSLVIVRNLAGVNTDKSQVNNTQPGSEPIAKDLRIVPPTILQEVAAGDPESATESFAGFAWSGATATFDGGSVGGNVGVVGVTEGLHILTVGGQNATDQVDPGPAPAADLAASPIVVPIAGTSNLAWQSPGGDVLSLAIDQGVGVGLAGVGNANVTPVDDTVYRLFLVTEQGGRVVSATVWVGEPNLLFSDGFDSGGTSRWSSTVP